MPGQYLIECRDRLSRPWFIVGCERTKTGAFSHAARYQVQHPTSRFRVTDLRSGDCIEINREAA